MILKWREGDMEEGKYKRGDFISSTGSTVKVSIS